MTSCEHYNRNAIRHHLFDYNVGKGFLDVDYIEAYFNKDLDEMAQIEELAPHPEGLESCSTIANFSTMRAQCRKPNIDFACE